MKTIRRICSLGLLVTVLSLASRTFASVDLNGTALYTEEDSPPVVHDRSKETITLPVQPGCTPPAETELRIGIPLWMAGLSGDFCVRGTVADLDVAFKDILKRIDMIAAGDVYYRYHRWEFFADGLYMRLSDDADLRGILFGNAHIAVKSAFAEAFVGYRLINCQQGYLSLIAGARYNYMSGDFRLNGVLAATRRTEGDTSWVDPVVGFSGRVHLWKLLSLWARADVGGFGVASDLTWQAQGGLEIQVSRRVYSQIGWMYLKNDYVSGGFTDKTAMNGPYLEAGITF